MEIPVSWETWKRALATAIGVGQKLGVSEDRLQSMTQVLGEFMATRIEPANREQRLLKDLWESGDTEEQKVLARLVYKLFDRQIHGREQ